MAVHSLPVSAEEDRPVDSFAHAQVDGSGGAWGERDGDVLAPLRRIRTVRCPRLVESCSMSAPNASEIRSPFNASSDANA